MARIREDACQHNSSSIDFCVVISIGEQGIKLASAKTPLYPFTIYHFITAARRTIGNAEKVSDMVIDWSLLRDLGRVAHLVCCSLWQNQPLLTRHPGWSTIMAAYARSVDLRAFWDTVHTACVLGCRFSHWIKFSVFSSIRRTLGYSLFWSSPL